MNASFSSFVSLSLSLFLVQKVPRHAHAGSLAITPGNLAQVSRDRLVLNYHPLEDGTAVAVRGRGMILKEFQSGNFWKFYVTFYFGDVDR